MIKVLIWQNGWGAKALSDCGHAAIALINGGTSTYISWWPDYDENGNVIGKGRSIHHDTSLKQETIDNLEHGSFAPKINQTKAEIVNIGGIIHQNAAETWIKVPHEVIDIPSVDDFDEHGPLRFGLIEENIKIWWRIYNARYYRNIRHRFELRSREYNCASIVMAALTAGGSRVYNKSDYYFYYTPNNIQDYAIDLQFELRKMNREANLILNQNLAIRTDLRRKSKEIWNEAIWKEESDRNVWFGRRKEQIAEIDNALRQYWACGDDWQDYNREIKSDSLRRIINSVQDHIIQKPRSDRREAVLTLGSQCLDVMAEKNQDLAAYMIEEAHLRVHQ